MGSKSTASHARCQNVVQLDGRLVVQEIHNKSKYSGVWVWENHDSLSVLFVMSRRAARVMLIDLSNCRSTRRLSALSRWHSCRVSTAIFSSVYTANTCRHAASILPHHAVSTLSRRSTRRLFALSRGRATPGARRLLGIGLGRHWPHRCLAAHTLLACHQGIYLSSIYRIGNWNWNSITRPTCPARMRTASQRLDLNCDCGIFLRGEELWSCTEKGWKQSCI